MKNFKDLIKFTNEQTSGLMQLAGKERKLIITEVKALSNLLNNINLYSNDRLELNTVKEEEGNIDTLVNFLPTVKHATKRILVKTSEYANKEFIDTQIVVDKFTKKLIKEVEGNLIQDIRTNSTKIAGADKTVVERLLLVKEHFADNQFLVAVGLGSYLEIAKDFKSMPFKVLYSPHLDNNEIIAYQKEAVAYNIALGQLDKYKNVLNGVVTYGLSIIANDTYLDINKIVTFN